MKKEPQTGQYNVMQELEDLGAIKSQNNSIQYQDIQKEQQSFDEKNETVAIKDQRVVNLNLKPQAYDNKINPFIQQKVPELKLSQVAYDYGSQRSIQITSARNLQSPKQQYKSRKNRQYDDDKSQDEEDKNLLETEGTASSSYVDTKGDIIINKPNPRFKNYRVLFRDLLKVADVTTMYPITSCILTYDSQNAVTVTKKGEVEYYIKIYNLETNLMVFEEKIGGNEGDYIKLKEVEQNSKGNKFALTYNNDGRFYVRSFVVKPCEEDTRDQKIHKRSPEEIKGNELDINGLLGIDNWTMCIPGFPDPFINCAFITDSRLFIVLFHNHSLTHYHFIYDMDKKQLVGKVNELKMDCSKKNFPYKTFYNETANEVYCFYRQGYSFIVDANDSSTYDFDRLTDLSLGQMYLIYNQALATRSSSEILFFKLEAEEDPETETIRKRWKQYHSIPVRGFVYYIKGNKRIQITSDDLIEFYRIDKETLMPHLENVMYNYMNCTQMMFGAKVKYCITYKTNQRSFTIYRSKYNHNFKVPVVTDNFEGCKGLEMAQSNMFLVSKVDVIKMYDIDKFQFIDELKINLLETDERERNEIIAIQKCQNEEWLAVISGKNLIRQQQQPNQLFIYRKVVTPGQNDKFEQKYWVMLKNIPTFDRVAMKFHFKIIPDSLERDSLLFAKMDRIFSLNFVNDTVTTIYKFTKEFQYQPLFFELNSQQNVFISASAEDALYYNIEEDDEIDIDQAFDICALKEIIYDIEDNVFYCLSNKYQERLGFFILKLSVQDTRNPSKTKFLMKVKNKFDIGDTTMFVVRDEKRGVKELIISSKTVYINTYDVKVLDISIDQDQTLTFRYEGFQLWESESAGFLLSKSQDFICVNRDGINVIALGDVDKRTIIDAEGNERIIHSLSSMNYLKVDKGNFLHYACQNQDKREVQVRQEYTKGKEDGEQQTEFLKIYSIKIWSITLREMLILNSLYLTKTLSQVVNLCTQQPDPGFFYKSFLELNGTNMTSILSFDSRSIEFLLSEDHKEHFNKDYPIFYKNKIQKGSTKSNKFYYRNAIDNALKNNQVQAANLIIKYIATYQNEFYSSFLLNKMFPSLIQKVSVDVESLLKSRIFHFEFDYESWPGSHNNSEKLSRPYNGSLFQLYHAYKEIFPEPEFDDILNEDGPTKDGIDSKQIYKIKYCINLLPVIGTHVEVNDDSKIVKNSQINLLEDFARSEELGMFESESLIDLIEFKWDFYAKNAHLVGAGFHFIQIGMLTYYVNAIYLSNVLNFKCLDPDCNSDNLQNLGLSDNIGAWLLLIFLTYPAIYESVYIFRTGPKDYFSELKNWFSAMYVLGSIAMSLLHVFLNPFRMESKLCMMLVIVLSIMRTFKFMSIFDKFSPIITILGFVIQDLIKFLTLFIVTVCLFSLVFGALGIGNDPTKDDISFEEYQSFGLLLGNVLNTFRQSIGEFGMFAHAVESEDEINIIFWIIWFIIVFVLNIIFLNFIIAEAGASYSKVQEFIEIYIYQQKAILISEAEDMMPDFTKSPGEFPKYIITRQKDE